MKFLLCGGSDKTVLDNMGKDRIKLTYFNFRGRGEWARLMMAYGGVEYEDYRIEQEDWPKIKPTMPNGHVPLLEVNGVKISQAIVIMHFLARKVGLTGKNDLEAAQAEMIVHTVYELYNKLEAATRKGDPSTVPQRYAEFRRNVVPVTVKYIEDALRENGGEWLVGNQVTWADIFVADLFGLPTRQFWGDEIGLESNFPAIIDHVDKVNGIPSIKRWRDKRPKTEL